MNCRLLALACLAMGLGLTATHSPSWPWKLPAGALPPAVPADNPMTPAKVELGRRLFYDADLSLDGTMSCATCHVQRHGFADSIASRAGVNGDPGRRNAPALANVAWLERLTLADPALRTLEQQVDVPVFGTHPVEMGMAGKAEELTARLSRDSCYRAMFANAFPGSAGITPGHVAMALASFQRSLISYRSAFDRSRLSSPARVGQALFARHCASCHAGPNFTDQHYHRIGAQEENPADRGLEEKTGRAEDRGKFRTPSLRNVAITEPYWHDGTVPTLPAAIARHEIALGAGERERIVAFLGALTDPEFVKARALSRPDKACGKPL